MARVDDMLGQKKTYSSSTTKKTTTTTTGSNKTSSGSRPKVTNTVPRVTETPGQGPSTGSTNGKYYATMGTGGGTDVDNNPYGGGSTVERSTSVANQGPGGYSGTASVITRAANNVTGGTSTSSASNQAAAQKQAEAERQAALQKQAEAIAEAARRTALEEQQRAMQIKKQEEAEAAAEAARVRQEAEAKARQKALEEQQKAMQLKKQEAADAANSMNTAQSYVTKTPTADAKAANLLNKLTGGLLYTYGKDKYNYTKNGKPKKEEEEDTDPLRTALNRLTFGTLYNPETAAPEDTGLKNVIPSVKETEDDLGFGAGKNSKTADLLNTLTKTYMGPYFREPLSNEYPSVKETEEDLGFSKPRSTPVGTVDPTIGLADNATNYLSKYLNPAIAGSKGDASQYLRDVPEAVDNRIGTVDPTTRLAENAIDYYGSTAPARAREQALSILASGYTPTSNTGGGTDLDNWAAAADTIRPIYYDANGNVVVNPKDTTGLQKYYYSNPLPSVIVDGEQGSHYISPGTTAEAKAASDALAARGQTDAGTRAPVYSGTGSGAGTGASGGGSNAVNIGGAVGDYPVNDLLGYVLGTGGSVGGSTGGKALTLDEIISAFTGGRGMKGYVDDIEQSLNAYDDDSELRARKNFQESLAGYASNAGNAMQQIQIALANALGQGYNDSAMIGAQLASGVQGSLNPLTSLADDINNARESYLANLLSITQNRKSNRTSAETAANNALANAATTAGYNFQGDAAALREAVAAIIAESMNS